MDLRSPTHTLGEYVYYSSGEPLHPLVGDVRVSWQYVAGGPVSIVARQAGASFAPFEYAGATLQLLQTGNLTCVVACSRLPRLVSIHALCLLLWLLHLCYL